jgi:predicted nucleotidyltransferase
MQGNESAAPALAEAFDRTADALAPAGNGYAVIGGFAVAFHGLARPTRDIDLLLAVPRIALPSVLEGFRQRGFTFDLESVIRELGQDHISKVHYQDVRVDLLDAVIPLFQRTVRRAREAELRGRLVRIASAEDLIALKMVAGREDDLRDVRGILAAQGGGLEIEEVRRSLAECCGAERIAAFERLVAEGGAS